MNKTSTPTLDEAVSVIRDLPTETQEALAHEMLERAGSISASLLSDEQQRIVKERMSRPRTHVPRADVMALFRKYNPNL